MMKPDQRMRLQRITRLRLAANVIKELKLERPELVALYVNHDIVQQLMVLAEQYEAKPLGPEVPPLRAKKVVHVLELGERKPPQRVAMSRRRPTIVPKKPTTNYLDMSTQELIDVGKKALAEQGKSPNHRKKSHAPDDPLGMRRTLEAIRKTPHATREFDDEAEHDEGQAYGSDTPDGSD